jgi:hypothetical protein
MAEGRVDVVTRHCPEREREMVKSRFGSLKKKSLISSATVKAYTLYTITGNFLSFFIITNVVHMHCWLEVPLAGGGKINK